MKNSKDVITNVKVVVHGKIVRHNSVTREQLINYFNLSSCAIITGEKNGRKMKFEYLSGKGFDWVEA